VNVIYLTAKAGNWHIKSRLCCSVTW